MMSEAEVELCGAKISIFCTFSFYSASPVAPQIDDLYPFQTEKYSAQTVIPSNVI
jgi:hypothetical protein